MISYSFVMDICYPFSFTVKNQDILWEYHRTLYSWWEGNRYEMWKFNFGHSGQSGGQGKWVLKIISIKVAQQDITCVRTGQSQPCNRVVTLCPTTWLWLISFDQDWSGLIRFDQVVCWWGFKNHTHKSGQAAHQFSHDIISIISVFNIPIQANPSRSKQITPIPNKSQSAPIKFNQTQHRTKSNPIKPV